MEECNGGVHSPTTLPYLEGLIHYPTTLPFIFNPQVNGPVQWAHGSIRALLLAAAHPIYVHIYLYIVVCTMYK